MRAMPPTNHSNDSLVTWRPPLVKQSSAMLSIFVFTYVVVFVLALVNNSLAVSAICRNRRLRTVTNYFLTNLAVADISVSVIVLPITLLSHIFSDWLFGAFLCKAVPYFQAVAVSASVDTLTAVAVERYLTITYPQRHIITPRRALVTIFVLWVVAFFIQSPWLVFYHEGSFLSGGVLHTQCYLGSAWSVSAKWVVLGVFLTVYVLPLSLITVFYFLVGTRVWKRRVQGIGGSKTEKMINQSKVRVTVMLVVVAAVFAVSWLPLYVVQIRVMFGPTASPWERDLIQNTLSPIFQWLGSANSCVNPIIYCFFSRNFRQSFFQCTRCSKDQTA